MDEPGRAALGAAMAVFDAQGRILLVRHTYGAHNWELPGGGALPSEDLASTASRELREETGLELVPGMLTGVYFEPQHDFGPFLHAVFRAELPLGATPVPDGNEVDAAELWPLDALPRPLSDFTDRRIEDARQARPSFAVITARAWLP